MEKNKAMEIEWENTLQILADKNASLRELPYFLNIAREYYKMRKDEPEVILLGTYFPEEIIRAMGIEFRYVFGGSYESTLLSDVSIPKDGDDETRSLLGTLLGDAFCLNRKDVVLLPLHSDSMKKLKALLSDTATVICFEVPSDKGDPVQKKRFENEIKRVTTELKKHFKKKLSKTKLKEQCRISKKAAVIFAELEELYKERGTALSASSFLFLASSYSMCKDKAEWVSHSGRLVCELRNNGEKPKPYPEIMLFGSPIYAPNYKILFAIEEMELRLMTIIHPHMEHVKRLLDTDAKSFSVEFLADRYLESDISPVYIKNTATQKAAMEAVGTGKIKGIVAHIIKGQPLFDYEFKGFEQFLANCKIPLNRIETVYNNSDIAQIKLRLEAFSEMLNMKNERR